MGFRDSLKHGWNAFRKGEQDREHIYEYGTPSYVNATTLSHTRSRLGIGTDRTFVATVLNRIAVDGASQELLHVDLDETGRYLGTRDSGLNSCLTVEANIDQGGTQFRQDVIQTLLEEGSIAIVPVETTGQDPLLSEAWDIAQLRVGIVKEWYPKQLRVEVYNEETGIREELVLPKKICAVVVNPFYTIMNQPNGIVARLMRKLTLLDSIDEQTGSGKLDMIIQLPYTIKTEARRQQADVRRAELERQMKDSQYGIGYTDSTEKIVQLNRPLENNMLKQVEYLTNQVYGHFGLSPAILDGSASEDQMLNYFNRTVEPILVAIKEAMIRSFLSRTARAQGQSIEFYFNPFKFVTASNMADIADKLGRNEVATSNEIRQEFGWKPILDDPKADKLINSNMPVDKAGVPVSAVPNADVDASSQDDIVNGALDQLDEQIQKILQDNS
jgi:hypothetical protein